MARPRALQSIGHLIPRGLARFGSNTSGATAVEFGLVAIPFFALLFAIIQTALVMFGSQALQAMTSTGARKIMTGEMKSSTFGDFKNAMCPTLPADRKGMAALFDCTKMLVQVQSFENFGSTEAGVINDKCFTLNPAPTSGDCFVPGGREKFVIVRVAYDWPFAVDLESLSHSTRITAVAAFRNEPF